MPVRHFIMPALISAFVVLAILPGYMAQEPRRVDFVTVEPSEAAPFVPVGGLEAARDYAEAHGLTDCVDPAHARLDDVILTVPTGSEETLDVTPVSFDEALASGEHDRWNALACRR